MRGGLRRLFLSLGATTVTICAGLWAAPAGAVPVEPFRIAVFGDSVIWGQGLPTEQKMWHLFAQDLQASTGRSVEVSNYSHSGAALSYLHPDGAVLPDDCADGNVAPEEVPDPAPAVTDCQIPRAAAAGQTFDFVILNGCINDLGVLPPMTPDYRTDTNITLGTAPIEDSVRRYCIPALTAALHQAHALAGSPKVALLGYYPFLSQETLNFVGAQFSSTPIGSAVNRSEEFNSIFDAVGAEAVRGAGGWATYVRSGLTGSNALMASEPRVFQGTDDPLYGQRVDQCAPYGDRFFGSCPIASIAHPNAIGNETYFRALNNAPAVQAWKVGWTVRR
jgi:lysophospholipase L1-like esterase